MLSDQLRQSTVVVIDDVSASLRLLESSVRAIGVRQVIAFSDSSAGLTWLQQHDWDLLLPHGDHGQCTQ